MAFFICKIQDMSAEYTEVAFLRKTHGVKGFIHIVIEDIFLDDVVKNKHLYLKFGKKMRPFFIDKLELSGKDIVKFEDISTPEEAKIYTQRPVYLENRTISFDVSDIEEESDLEYKYLEGYMLSNTDKEIIGVIEEVIEMPQQEMLVVTYKGKEVLLPINPTLIVSIEEPSKSVVLEIVEGLLDL